MSKFTHGILQVLAVVIQVANLSLAVVPPKYQPLVTAVVGAIQAALGLSNHKVGV